MPRVIKAHHVGCIVPRTTANGMARHMVDVKLEKVYANPISLRELKRFSETKLKVLNVLHLLLLCLLLLHGVAALGVTALGVADCC